MRYFIEFSYDGSAYHGWQRQPKAISIQQTMEEAMSTLLRSSVKLVGAGRTDAGVHARQLFAHFDLDEAPDYADLVHRLNSFLPDDISVKQILRVNPNAHARFDALERTYEYLVVQHKDPFLFNWAHYVHLPLDVQAMNLACAELLKHTDFECFSKSNTDVKTYVCHLKEANWSEQEDRLVFRITADRFLRNMVRAIVGTLLDVGLGKSAVEDVNHIIKSRNRSEAGVSVPAKGLYLTRISYPESLFQIHG